MDFEMRRASRLAMRAVPERMGLQFADGQIEMRARPNGTAAGSDFEWNGYASVYNTDFPMWDQDGEPFTEYVEPGAFRRSLANPALDVPFLVGHNNAGIPFARTKSGTMRLSEDTHGLHVHVPSMDGSREEVRALASAVERGDLDEMSLAFICNRQQWDSAYERRGIVEADVHRGDVCAVVHGANAATAGAWMAPVEQLAFRRPAAIGAPARLAELLSVPQAERDKAKAAGNSLPDGSYPVNNVSQLHSAAILAASHHGDWKAAQVLIRRRAKELGVDVTTLPGFGEQKSAGPALELRDAAASHGHHDAEQNAPGRPLELRASAAEDVKAATAPDYDPDAAAHDDPQDCMTCNGNKMLPNPSTGVLDMTCPGCNGTGAVVQVDDTTGIPGGEQPLSAGRRLELRLRELELEELAHRQAPGPVTCLATPGRRILTAT